MFKSLNSGARLVELLNSVDRLGELLQLGESNWWNGQIGSDSVNADIRHTMTNDNLSTIYLQFGDILSTIRSDFTFCMEKSLRES